MIAADIVNSERAFSKVFVQYPPLFQFRSVQFSPLADWVIRRDMKDDSAEILFQSFLQEALVSSSGMGRGAILILLNPFPALQDPQQSVSSSLFPTGHGVPPDF